MRLDMDLNRLSLVLALDTKKIDSCYTYYISWKYYPNIPVEVFAINFLGIQCCQVAFLLLSCWPHSLKISFEPT